MTRIRILLGLLLLPWPLAAQAPGGHTLPDWQRHGVCYELFVRSFYDGDGDGTGDLRGLIEKLDYINDGDAATSTDLGASCIWLMPIAQSPSYHGYDVSNYFEVNRDYGTRADFLDLVRAAHARGIRVIVDLVPNHMSSEHPYFRSALLDPRSPYRDWFRWSPTVLPSPGWEAAVWHRAPGREEYYYGLFWQGMPDINLASAEATRHLKDVARFWLEELQVDGFRMDAVRHLFEGPNGEWKHAPAVYPWLRDYAGFIRQVSPAAFTVGEVWDVIDSIVPYYPDQLDSYFTFEVADGLVDAVRSGSGRKLLAAVARAQEAFPPGRWSPFLRNHDQPRLMHELAGDGARARLAVTLLLTMPGFPFLYYGEELGMSADKPDPRLRTPMHWTLERAAGFTKGVPWEPLLPDSFTANVAAQHEDPGSLLNHHRRLIRLRASQPALAADAKLRALDAGSDAVVAWLRTAGEAAVLVLANLGDASAAPVLASADAVLPRGNYRVRPLLGDAPAGTLRVGRDGRVRGWQPVRALPPRDAVVLELDPER